MTTLRQLRQGVCKDLPECSDNCCSATCWQVWSGSSHLVGADFDLIHFPFFVCSCISICLETHLVTGRCVQTGWTEPPCTHSSFGTLLHLSQSNMEDVVMDHTHIYQDIHLDRPLDISIITLWLFTENVQKVGERGRYPPNPLAFLAVKLIP